MSSRGGPKFSQDSPSDFPLVRFVAHPPFTLASRRSRSQAREFAPLRTRAMDLPPLLFSLSVRAKSCRSLRTRARFGRRILSTGTTSLSPRENWISATSQLRGVSSAIRDASQPDADYRRPGARDLLLALSVLVPRGRGYTRTTRRDASTGTRACLALFDDRRSIGVSPLDDPTRGGSRTRRVNDRRIRQNRKFRSRWPRTDIPTGIA